MVNLDWLAEQHFADSDPAYKDDWIAEDCFTGEPIDLDRDDYVEVWDGVVLKDNYEDYKEAHKWEFTQAEEDED